MAKGMPKLRRNPKSTRTLVHLSETALAYAYGAVELTKVVAGSLLMMTVPMACGDHMCTPAELIFDPIAHLGDTITFAAIIMNFTALAVSLAHYLVLFWREHTLIELLEEEAGVANSRLHETLEGYPLIKARLLFTERVTLTSSMIFLGSTVLNAILSGIVAFGCTYNVMINCVSAKAAFP